MTLQTDVVKTSQDLLKIEWQVVKRGEPFYNTVKNSLVLIVIFGGIGTLIYQIAANRPNPSSPESSLTTSTLAAPSSPPG